MIVDINKLFIEFRLKTGLGSLKDKNLVKDEMCNALISYCRMNRYRSKEKRKGGIYNKK